MSKERFFGRMRAYLLNAGILRPNKSSERRSGGAGQHGTGRGGAGRGGAGRGGAGRGRAGRGGAGRGGSVASPLLLSGTADKRVSLADATGATFCRQLSRALELTPAGSLMAQLHPPGLAELPAPLAALLVQSSRLHSYAPAAAASPARPPRLRPAAVTASHINEYLEREEGAPPNCGFIEDRDKTDVPRFLNRWAGGKGGCEREGGVPVWGN